MLDGSNSDPIDDAVTREDFIKGNTLFMLGSQNGITDSDTTTDEFGLMPYLSEDGSKNIYILSVGRYYGLNKQLENDSQKLKDALKVMEVLSTVEGTSSLYPEESLKASLLPFKDQCRKYSTAYLHRMGKYTGYYRNKDAGIYAEQSNDKRCSKAA